MHISQPSRIPRDCHGTCCKSWCLSEWRLCPWVEPSAGQVPALGSSGLPALRLVRGVWCPTRHKHGCVNVTGSQKPHTYTEESGLWLSLPLPRATYDAYLYTGEGGGKEPMPGGKMAIFPLPFWCTKMATDVPPRHLYSFRQDQPAPSLSSLSPPCPWRRALPTDRWTQRLRVSLLSAWR